MFPNKFLLLLGIVLLPVSGFSADLASFKLGLVKTGVINNPDLSYLEKATGRHVELEQATDLDDLLDKVNENQVQFAYLPPRGCFNSRTRRNIQLLVKNTDRKKPFFQYTIVVNEDSPIHTLDDLAGKRFGFGSRSSVLEQATVEQSGIPFNRFGQREFLGDGLKIIDAIVRGNIDAGIVVDRWAIAAYPRGVRILYSSLPIPNNCIVANNTIEKGVMKKMKSALINLDGKVPNQHEILKLFGLQFDGFAPAKEWDYRNLHKLVFSR